MDAVLAVAAELIDERPRTKAELRTLLAPMWPTYDADSIANGVAYLLPLVQVPPRGLWGRSGGPTLARLETWLEAALDARDRTSTRWSCATSGPSARGAVIDPQEWSGLTRLAEVFERLRPGLVTFRAESGRELFDLPDAPRPDADAGTGSLPAPVRQPAAGARRPQPDVPDGARALAISPLWVGSFLVDGMVGGTWRVEDAGTRRAPSRSAAEPLEAQQLAEAERRPKRWSSFLRPRSDHAPGHAWDGPRLRRGAPRRCSTPARADIAQR